MIITFLGLALINYASFALPPKVTKTSKLNKTQSNQTYVSNKTVKPTVTSSKTDEVTFKNYLNEVPNKIFPFWQPPEGINKVIATLNINKAGVVLSSKLESMPKSKLACDAVNLAISKTTFAPLNFGDNSVAILTLTFNSNYDPHGSGKSNIGCRLEVRQLNLQK